MWLQETKSGTAGPPEDKACMGLHDQRDCRATLCWGWSQKTTSGQNRRCRITRKQGRNQDRTGSESIMAKSVSGTSVFCGMRLGLQEHWSEVCRTTRRYNGDHSVDSVKWPRWSAVCIAGPPAGDSGGVPWQAQVWIWWWRHWCQNSSWYSNKP